MSASANANIKARRRRLIVLAEFLEGFVLPILDGAKFNMSVWAASRKKAPVYLSLHEARECGFTGCALGWGLLSPQLRRAGIHRTLIHGSYTCNCGVCRGRTAMEFSRSKAREFFGVSADEFATAFLGEGRGRRGVVAVAKRLRRVAEQQPELAP